jgi:hypothetical protein
MARAWAVEGGITKELLTFRGAVLWHDNPHELEFLMEKTIAMGSRIVELPSAGIGRPLMRLRDHPGMAAVSFPLRREDFN